MLGGGNNSAERIRGGELALVDEWGIKKNIGERGTAPKRRLGSELGQNQFFDWIIEKTPAGTNTSFAIAAENFGQGATAEIRAVGQTNAGCKSLVIGRGHSRRNAFVAGNHQAGRGCAGVAASRVRHAQALPVSSAVGYSARIHSGILPGPKCFHVAAYIGQRRGEFPTQTVIQSQVGPDLPAILNEGVNRCAAHIFALPGALGVGVRQTEEEFGVLVAVTGNDGIGAAVIEYVFAVDVKIVILVEAGTADVHAELEGVIALYPCETVGPLKAISYLRQESFPIVPEGGSARDVDEGDSGEACGKPRRNTQIGGVTEFAGDRRRIGSSGKAECRGGASAGGGNRICMLRLDIPELAFTHICKVRFIDE